MPATPMTIPGAPFQFNIAEPLSAHLVENKKWWSKLSDFEIVWLQLQTNLAVVPFETFQRRLEIHMGRHIDDVELTTPTGIKRLRADIWHCPGARQMVDLQALIRQQN